LSLASGESGSIEVEKHIEQCSDCGRRLEHHAAAMRTALDWQVGSARTTVDAGPASTAGKHPSTFGDKYMVVGKLGSGGQANVYRAVDRRLKRDVAIKWSPKTSDAKTKDMLQSEGEKLAKLTHPGIVRVYEIDTQDDRPFLVMEYAGGRNLKQFASQETITPGRAAGITIDLARALAYAHRSGVIHQDVKPENVLVNADGQPQLADFGIARLRDLWNEDELPARAGTPGYMAPEQIRDPKQVSATADVYGLGGVLFFLLTGEAPRKVHRNPYVAQEQISAGEIDWTPLTAKQRPRELVAICRKALAVDAGQRYQNADDMAADLERFVNKRSPLAPLAFIAASILVMAALVTIFITLKNHSTEVTEPHLVLRLIRSNADGTAKETHISPAKPDDWDRSLPVVATDSIGISGRLPRGTQGAIFAVTLSAAEFELRDLGMPQVSDDTFRIDKVFPLEGSPATELVLLCASTSNAPTHEDVAAILKPLPIWGAKDYGLPSNKVLSFNSEKVAQLGRIGDGKEDPMNATIDALQQIRLALRQRYAHVAGLAFIHVANGPGAAVNRNEAAQGDKQPIEGGTKEEKELFHEVMNRLLQTREVRDNVPKDVPWPPQVYIIPASDKDFQAGTRLDKSVSIAVITEGYMRKVVKGDKHVLAAIMGHELVHLLKKHPGYQKEVLNAAVSRENELEADVEGAKIAVAAGFLDESGVRAAMIEIQAFGNMPHLPGLKINHPPWAERLQKLDRDRAKIWTSMAAFDNGNFFLYVEQYRSAESCFEAVTKTYPECKEAWANLGYARLMQYCDGLEEKELRQLGIGQFAAGCFYSRPTGLVPTRGAVEVLWKKAVQSLEKACELDDAGNLVLARANLGLAYLVHPDLKPDTEKALKYFGEIVNKKDKGLDELSRVALLLNFAVAERAAGKHEKAREKIGLASSLYFQTLKDRDKQKREKIVSGRPQFDSVLLSQLDFALLFNFAMLDAHSKKIEDKRFAFGDLELYLRKAGSSSTWWAIAYDHYEKLGKELNLPTAKREELAKRFLAEMPRVVSGIELSTNKSISLSDNLGDVLKVLGKEKATGIPTFRFAKVQRYFAVAPGIDLLADKRVLSIYLTTNKAPPVIVQPTGLGSAKKELRIGMSIREFNDAVQGQITEKQARFIDDPATAYVSYPELGLALRFANQQVQEIAIVQIPRK